MKRLLVNIAAIFVFSMLIFSCKKEQPIELPDFVGLSATIDDISKITPTGISLRPKISIHFSSGILSTSASSAIRLEGYSGQLNVSVSDSTLLIQPEGDLAYLEKYRIVVTEKLKSIDDRPLKKAVSYEFYTLLDPSDKLPRIDDAALLDSVQRRTFRYFWEFGHPVSGLARERNSSGDLVTSGGSGFGMMAIPVGIERGFITRRQGLDRATQSVDFLLNKADRFHGAFPHWLSGTTGKVIPFSSNDNGADLVETSFLIAGLLTLREYFDGQQAEEVELRRDIDSIWQGVEWDWFRRDGKDILYWHWSPDKGWSMNLPISGWNECLITYILAASSPAHGIPPEVYHRGWASNVGIVNNQQAYGINLPLGSGTGGPLFFEHYSFLGIDPRGLKDQYADYWEQVRAHTLINRAYCIANPRHYYGYGPECWGLTAGDVYNGYTASSPANDVSVIGPTAALSSMPYTPEESLDALHFFYYKLGDRLWGKMGFYDGFSLDRAWFAESTLAIDQGPIVIMIENYRTALIWNLLMKAPEIKAGMEKLGFESPHF